MTDKSASIKSKRRNGTFSRNDAIAFVKRQFQRIDLDVVAKKCGRTHYGRTELATLLGLIYGEPVAIIDLQDTAHIHRKQEDMAARQRRSRILALDAGIDQAKANIQRAKEARMTP